MGVVVEVAAGGGEVEPVGGGELAGEEPGHGRLGAIEEAVGVLEDGSGGEGEGGGDGASDGAECGGVQDPVDEVPEGRGSPWR